MLQAVALVIVSPQGRMFTLRELREKPDYEKKAGMLSFPLETKEEGESDGEALRRLLLEEVGVEISLSEKAFLGSVEMDFLSGKKSRLFCYLCLSTKEFPGDPRDNDVSYHGWLTPNDFLRLDVELRRKEVLPVLRLLPDFQEFQ